MRTPRIATTLVACLLLPPVAACGGRDEKAEFRSNFDGAVKAAEKGKELVKSPASARRASRAR